MGFPLVRSVFGEEAMPHAAVFMVVFLVMQWTYGVLLIGGRDKVSPKNALINPGTVSFAAGIGLYLLNVKLPWPIGNAVTFINDINTPLAMMVIGSQMADANILALFKQPILYLSSSLRLLVIPTVVMFALLPLKLPPLVYCTSVILSAAPSAGATAMFAQRFERDTATAASAVSLSTLMSILTLPLFAVLSKLLIK
jgi:predicted permease